MKFVSKLFLSVLMLAALPAVASAQFTAAEFFAEKDLAWQNAQMKPMEFDIAKSSTMIYQSIDSSTLTEYRHTFGALDFYKTYSDTHYSLNAMMVVAEDDFYEYYTDAGYALNAAEDAWWQHDDMETAYYYYQLANTLYAECDEPINQMYGIGIGYDLNTQQMQMEIDAANMPMP